MKKQSRNLGVDVLRIVSMLGVVVLHVMGHGGLLKVCQTPLKFSMAWFLELLAYPAVNCFVLISGYIGYRGERVFPKLKNLLALWFTVLFYSVTIGAVFMALGIRAINAEEILTCLQPTVNGTYWFFSAYVGMFLLSPFLNMLVHRSNFKQGLIFLMTVAVFSVFSLEKDPFDLLDGYSVIWMVLVYTAGATIKKHGFDKLLSKTAWLLTALGAFLLTWGAKVGFYFSDHPYWHDWHGKLVNYTSPTILLMAVGLLALFANMRWQVGAKLISFISVSAFSVYLIHDNPFVRKNVIAKIPTLIGDFHGVKLALSVVGLVVGIFAVCILADKVRVGLFRLLRIDALCERIETLVKKVIRKWSEKLKDRIEKTTE